MIDVFSPAGRAALTRLVDAGALLGFDFDGTLAPIRTRPDDVRMDARAAAAFTALAARLPVAVITGRGVDDVRPLLPGTPRWVIGNHGAEGMPDSDPARLASQAATCAAWRAQLQGSGALGNGIILEDKRYTLSVHYRQAPDHDAARARIAPGLAQLLPAPHIVSGKCVLNLLPAGSADKFSALQRLAQDAGHGLALFVGDDENDEMVFRQAPPEWVTVKVGSDAASAARYVLPDQAAVADLLTLLLELSAESGRGRP